MKNGRSTRKLKEKTQNSRKNSKLKVKNSISRRPCPLLPSQVMLKKAWATYDLRKIWYRCFHKIWVRWPRRVWEGWWSWWLYVLLLQKQSDGLCFDLHICNHRHDPVFHLFHYNQTEAKIVVFRLALRPHNLTADHIIFIHLSTFIIINRDQEIKDTKREPNHVFVSTGPTVRKMVRGSG